MSGREQARIAPPVGKTRLTVRRVALCPTSRFSCVRARERKKRHELPTCTQNAARWCTLLTAKQVGTQPQFRSMASTSCARVHASASTAYKALLTSPTVPLQVGALLYLYTVYECALLMQVGRRERLYTHSRDIVALKFLRLPESVCSHAIRFV